jgi:hypothetical protein
MVTPMLRSLLVDHRWLAAAIAAAVVVVGLRWSTFAVGGSDSYCYVYQAQRWAGGTLQPVEPLARQASWPDAPLTFTPTGHVPSPTVPGAIAPICPAGLSIVMAPLLVGTSGQSRAVFLVVPVFGALLVWATYLIGLRFSARVGVASAALVACSPITLFQLMQPMSDVPAAALWALATACATASRRSAPALAGLATSAAILMRPNLVPLGLVLGLFILVRPDRGWSKRIRDAAMFAGASAPGCVAVGVIQQIFYGSPLRSGYGSAAALFSAANVGPNAIRYFQWMQQAHTPVWLVACAAPFVLPGWLTALLLTLAMATVVSYLPYVVFNDWWYLRFMLPGIVPVLVLTVAVLDRLLTWAGGRVMKPAASPRLATGIQAALVACLTAALCVLFVAEARARSVFDLRRLESRYVRAGEYVAGHLPANALVVTSWESGSVRYYSNRKTVAWDVLDPAWLDRMLAESRALGYEPYLLLERWEEPLFRERFTGTALGALDWPPSVEIASQVRIYRPEDRQRYLRGQDVETDYAR